VGEKRFLRCYACASAPFDRWPRQQDNNPKVGIDEEFEALLPFIASLL
jgi:hypothetical protein